MTRHTGERHGTLATDIRRQFGEKSTMRFLQALPAFKVMDDMPSQLRTLLDKLEEAESRATGTAR